MNESELQRVYIYPIYPRESKTHSDKGFVNIDDASQCGTHWCCFMKKDIKSFYIDSFGGETDNFLLDEIPKPIINFSYRIQNIVFNLCRSYCLYFFYPVERVNYNDAILKLHFC